MSAPDGFPLTAAKSPRVQWVDTTDSTNADVVAAVVTDPDAWPHLSLLVTDDQRAGRGRLDRTWTAPPGTALALSVVVDVAAIPAASRGWVPLIAGAAMTRAIAEPLRSTGHAVELKWPNDVLLDGGKVCGILAEVVGGVADRIVIGAGVNTRMTAGDLPVSTATSLRVAGVEVDDDRLVSDYLTFLDEQLRALADGGGDASESGVRATVEARCATIGRDVRVALPDGTDLRGTAVRLDQDGRLVVRTEAVDTPVAAGDVVHVR